VRADPRDVVIAFQHALPHGVMLIARAELPAAG
jgi:hypothetical protein